MTFEWGKAQQIGIDGYDIPVSDAGTAGANEVACVFYSDPTTINGRKEGRWGYRITAWRPEIGILSVVYD